MIQKRFLDYLQEHLPLDVSLIESVAMALDISYDAAHRRTSLKSKFSLEECVHLAKYFNCSLDRLFELTDKQFVTVERTAEILKEADLEHYFQNSIISLKPLLKIKDAKILYSAKDIPLFYLLQGNTLTKFKVYVWLKFLDTDFSSKSFESYAIKLSVLEKGKSLGELYSNLNITEIWDITTINSTLKQIHFYYKAGQLSLNSALTICDELKALIITLKDKASLANADYQIYHNELLLMNNNVLVCTPNQKSLYVPNAMLSYYLTTDSEACKQAEIYLEKQLQQSTLLNTSGEKTRNSFFNKLQQKIEALAQLLKASESLDFQ